MKFLLEKIDLTKIKQLYFLRGYEKAEDDNFCTSMVLLGDNNDEFKGALLLSRKQLTQTDGKDLMKYLKNTGMKITADMKITAEVLKADFDKFYNTRAFERIKL